MFNYLSKIALGSTIFLFQVFAFAQTEGTLHCKLQIENKKVTDLKLKLSESENSIQRVQNAKRELDGASGVILNNLEIAATALGEGAFQINTNIYVKTYEGESVHEDLLRAEFYSIIQTRFNPNLDIFTGEIRKTPVGLTCEFQHN